jgi:hypothetical protein
VDVPQVSEPELRAASCRCGVPRPVDVPPNRCVGDEAVDHTRRVCARAELLLARMEAVRALGTLTSELRPLAAFADPA